MDDIVNTPPTAVSCTADEVSSFGVAVPNFDLVLFFAFLAAVGCCGAMFKSRWRMVRVSKRQADLDADHHVRQHPQVPAAKIEQVKFDKTFKGDGAETPLFIRKYRGEVHLASSAAKAFRESGEALAAVEKAIASIAHLHSQPSKAKDDLEAMRKKIASLQKVLDAGEGEIDEHTKESGELVAIETAVIQMAALRRESQEDLETLRQSIAVLRAAHAHVADGSKLVQIASVREALLKALSEHIASLRRDLTPFQPEIDEQAWIQPLATLPEEIVEVILKAAEPNEEEEEPVPWDEWLQTYLIDAAPGVVAAGLACRHSGQLYAAAPVPAAERGWPIIFREDHEEEILGEDGRTQTVLIKEASTLRAAFLFNRELQPSPKSLLWLGGEKCVIIGVDAESFGFPFVCATRLSRFQEHRWHTVHMVATRTQIVLAFLDGDIELQCMDAVLDFAKWFDSVGY